MDKDSAKKTDPIYWSNQQFERFLCCLCYALLFPPMQLICCGARICAACGISKLQQLSQCPFCEESGIPQAKDDKGFRRELEGLSINCPRCNDKSFGLFKDLPTHLNNKHCDLECENCDEKFVFSQQLTKHQQETCKKRTVCCPLDFIGCSKKVRYDEMVQHYLNNQHQQCLILFIKKVFPKSFQGQTMSILPPFFNEQYNHMLTAALEKINSIVQNIEPIIHNCAHLISERQKHETNLNEIRAQSMKTKESSDRNVKLTENYHQDLVNMNKSLADIKLKSITGPKLLSSDNTYIYKFNILSLNSNGQTIQSEPAHTSQSGYKVAISCDIFVDGQNKKRYLSISFINLPGEFDPILSWPFRFPVTITILDLKGTKKNISQSISWDSQTVPANRPVNNPSVSFKIQQFCLVDKLLDNTNTYIQDELIFVQLYINFMAPSAHPTTNTQQSRVIHDPIQTNILSNMMNN